MQKREQLLAKMHVNGAHKLPGMAGIADYHTGKIHRFVMKDDRHPNIKLIYQKLHDMHEV
jgi:hypothetical protein